MLIQQEHILVGLIWDLICSEGNSHKNKWLGKLDFGCNIKGQVKVTNFNPQ